MAPLVTFTLTAKQTIVQPSKEAEASLANLGKRAVTAGEQILSIEKARAGIEVIAKAGEIASKAFGAMAANSAAMKGELGAASSQMGKLAGSFGDSLANSAGFKLTIDAVTDALVGLTDWAQENGDVVGDVFAGSVRSVIPVVKGLILSVAGLLETISVARNMIPAIRDDAENAVEVGLHGAEALFAWSNQWSLSASVRRKAAEDMAAAADAGVRAASVPQATGRALADAAAEVGKIDKIVGGLTKTLDTLDAQLAKKDGAVRATRIDRGDGKASAAAARIAAENRQIMDAMAAADQEEFERIAKHEEEVRAAQNASLRRIGAANIAANKAAFEAEKAQQKAQAEEMRQAKAAENAILAGLTTDFITESLTAIVQGGAVGDAMLAMVGSSLTRLGSAMVATGVAALLGGPAMALFGLSGPGLIAAGAGVTLAGAGLGAAAAGSGGGGGGGSVSSSTSAPRQTATSGGGAVAGGGTTIIYQVAGSMIREAELGRDTLVAQRRAQRSGVSR